MFAGEFLSRVLKARAMFYLCRMDHSFELFTYNVWVG